MGEKRLRNKPILHDEIKQRRTIALTDTAYQSIRDAANNEGISLSEFVERWGRQLKLQSHSSHT